VYTDSEIGAKKNLLLLLLLLLLEPTKQKT
jgi:hypothetical protein